jgi:hypothetical protein
MERATNKTEWLRQLEALLLVNPEGLHPAEIARRLGVHGHQSVDRSGFSPIMWARARWPAGDEGTESITTHHAC